jgi:hypothetical protein
MVNAARVILAVTFATEKDCTQSLAHEMRQDPEARGAYQHRQHGAWRMGLSCHG